jgi:elongation factor G
MYAHVCCSSVYNAVQSMKQRLGVQPLLTQIPLGGGRDFRGVVDLVHNCALLWPNEGEATSFLRSPLKDLPQDIQGEAHHHKEQLLEQVQH